MRRIASRQEKNRIERQRSPTFLGRSQMSVMDRVERAPKNTDTTCSHRQSVPRAGMRGGDVMDVGNPAGQAYLD